MSLNITQTEINTLWDKGYRPFEIYTSNPEPVMYHGKMEETNAVGGWDIKHIFATRDEIENYPNFDCIIMIDSVGYCTEIFHGNEGNANCLTKNQTKAMEVLVKSGMENTGAKCIEDMMDDPFLVVQASDLVESGWSQKQAEGTFGSLVASGHILHDEGGNAANDLYVLDGEEEKFENLRQFVEKTFNEEVA